jgi:hypothetical protein
MRRPQGYRGVYETARRVRWPKDLAAEKPLRFSQPQGGRCCVCSDFVTDLIFFLTPALPVAVFWALSSQ